MINHFARLGVGPRVSGDALRRAFRDKARDAHPDRGGEREDFEELRTSYGILRDPSLRSEYERQFFAFLREQRAVLCPACGEANRIPPDQSLGCHHCQTDLPIRRRSVYDSVDEAGQRFRQRGIALSEQAADQLAQVGDRLVGEVSNLLSDGVDAGIAAIRRRLRIDPSQRRRRP